jgi:transcription antitermination factor NusG
MKAEVGCHREAVGVAPGTSEVAEDPRLLPDRGRDAYSRWCVLHVLSRHEKVLARLLRARGLSFFLPLGTTVTYHGRRKVRVEGPLFPGYLFLWGTLDEAYEADRTGHLAAIILVDDQDRLEWELQNLYRALARGAKLKAHPAIPEGTKVVVRAGPMKGIEGVVRKTHGGDRLILQVGMLGTAVSLDVDASLLVPLG